jgi:activator of 2-hydroxyglutaryl-CoA dehydratase
MIYTAGIDVGSTQTKGIIINQDQEILARALIMTGANVTRAGENCFNEALKLAGIRREQVV